jgi:uric acid-xanthine permease
MQSGWVQIHLSYLTLLSLSLSPCLPFPYCLHTRVDEKVPILLSMMMGLQHSLAMVGGLITPPLVVFKFSVCFTCLDLQQYAIAAALISSGICSLINCSKIPIPFTKGIFGRQMYLGAGVLSVMGTSFTFLPIYEISISQMKDSGIEGTVAYGKLIGTTMVCCLFPPITTAVTVILIGVALIGTGMKYWGGGVGKFASVSCHAVWGAGDKQTNP